MIDKILAARNEELLEAIESIFISTQKEDVLSFSTEQNEMLMMSENDIKESKLISEFELDKLDT